ncbi:uncharacterized protein LOC142621553 [Castanea sativa]|uniref:uncharacterized protein LOC142621553 n=1 Tax=Castanea sativa TaxID=21020 RepID=UPI003F650223
MEVLGAFISEKCEAKLWDPIVASRGGLAFSHLFFADNLVLFAKADQKNCTAIKDALNTFCELSSEKVSVDKFQVFFSPNTPQHTRDNLCNVLEFRSTPSLGKYLGFPIKHTSISQDFGAVIDHVQSRLASWKTHLLSFAGRLVLTQATIATIPNYYMQYASLPPKITQCVDKLCCNFLWGSTNNKKKLHLVNWRKITKPKEYGGLRLQSAKEKNIALLAKLNWRFHQEKDNLWARVLSHKYRPRPRQPLSRPRTCSAIWTALKKGEKVFKSGTKWIVGNDSNLREGPVKSLIMDPLNRGEDSLLLKDIVHNNSWDWGRLSFVFPAAFHQKIKATPIPIVAGGVDRLSWSSSPNGDFELKEAYRLACLTEKSNQFDSFMGSWVWEVLTLPKIKCFLWQCAHQSIPVRDVFTERGRSSGGGKIRNSNGEWVSGYARAIGTTTSVAAELWALRDGLNLCISLNLQAMEIELDAKLVVDLISKEGSKPNNNDVIVTDCREGLKKIPRVRVLHCNREANKCADALAREFAPILKAKDLSLKCWFESLVSERRAMPEVRSSELETGLLSSDDPAEGNTAVSVPQVVMAFHALEEVCGLDGETLSRFKDRFQFPDGVRVRLPHEEE